MFTCYIQITPLSIRNAPLPPSHLQPLRNLRNLLQLEADDFARRWEMLGNASKEENGEVWAGAPVTAARWAEVRGMVTSAIKMGEHGCGWAGERVCLFWHA